MMEYIQIFVVFAFLGILCDATRRTKLHHYNPSLESSQDSSNCICLPRVENAQLLPDIIGSEGVGLERLVVYFYINSQTYEITAHTPNEEKQRLFPDLPLDPGDNLVSIESEKNLNNFVLMNPNKVVTVGRDIINNLLNEKPEESFISVPNVLDGNEELPINVQKDVNFPVIEPLINEIYNTPDAINDIMPPKNNEAVYIQPNANIKIGDHVNQQKYKGQQKENQLLPTQEPVMTLQNFNQPPSNILHGWQTDSMNNVFKWNNYGLNDKGNQPAEDVQNFQRPGYLQFDQWFQQQMNSPLNKENGLNIRDDVLKNLVYKNLFQNGIIFMDNGILKTYQGDTLNLSNLKLQPILVGLLDYDYPTAGVQSKIVPPYYDAKALYMNHPQKILGVIPMSSGYNSSPIGYTTMKVKKFIPNVVSSTILKTQCFNGKCYTNTVAQDFPFRSGQPEKDQKDVEDVSDRSAQDANEEVIKIYRGPGNQLGIVNIKQLENAHNKRKAKPVPIANDFLAKLYGMILGEESDSKNSKKMPSYEISTIEDDGPDFRIVGGSAATGSGTPVSSRGRSAFG